jgi:hypothetical protein
MDERQNQKAAAFEGQVGGILVDEPHSGADLRRCDRLAKAK